MASIIFPCSPPLLGIIWNDLPFLAPSWRKVRIVWECTSKIPGQSFNGIEWSCLLKAGCPHSESLLLTYQIWWRVSFQIIQTTTASRSFNLRSVWSMLIRWALLIHLYQDWYLNMSRRAVKKLESEFEKKKPKVSEDKCAHTKPIECIEGIGANWKV